MDRYAHLVAYFCWLCDAPADPAVPAEPYPGRDWPARFCSFIHRAGYLALAEL